MTTNMSSEMIEKLEEIKNYDFYKDIDSMENGDLPFQKIWNQLYKPKLSKAIDAFLKIEPFLEEEHANIYKYCLDNIIKNYDEIISDPKTKLIGGIEKLAAIIRQIDNDKSYLKNIISMPNDIDIHNIICFISDYFVENHIEFNKDYYISKIQEIDIESLRVDALNNIIEYYNSSLDGRPIGLYLNQTDGIISNFNKLKTQRDINETKIAIESAKNEDLVKAFKERADGLRVYIILLNAFIVALFLAMILVVFENYYNFDQSKDLLRTFPLILVLTGFIAFLTKEKNVISAQYHSNIKCHIELSALSTYVVGLDKEKVENLKIHLADKYFTGNSDVANNNQGGLNNENYNQIISLLKESIKK